MSRRNQFDVLLSEAKQRASTYTLNWKCDLGADKCIQEHKAQRVLLDTTNLVGVLREHQRQQDKSESLLDYHQVPYIKATYEALLLGEDTEPWIDLFRFLCVGPSEGLTMERVKQACGTADTSFHKNEDVLSNYEEFKQHWDNLRRMNETTVNQAK